MGDTDTDSWLTEAVAEGVKTVRETYRTVLGVEREAYVCEVCETACEPAHTHDPQRAAFDGGESPSWYCPACETHYVREVDDSQHAMDLYGRGPPE